MKNYNLPNTTLLDGTVGISKETKRQLELHNLLNTKDTKGTIKIVNSKDKSLIDRSIEILKK